MQEGTCETLISRSRLKEALASTKILIVDKCNDLSKNQMFKLQVYFLIHWVTVFFHQ